MFRVDAIKRIKQKQIITDQANSKKQKLIKRLMQQTKSVTKAKVDEAVTTAKNAIDQATNNDGVDTAKQTV